MDRFIPNSLLALTLLTAAAAQCRADEALRPDMARIAGGIKKVLESRNVESIAVGHFAAPAGYTANYGPGIEDMLGQELQKQKVRIDGKAAYKVQGDFVTATLKDAQYPNDLLVLKLNFRIYDGTGEQVVELPVDVKPLHVKTYQAEVVAKALGYSGPLAPKGDQYKRNEDVQKYIGEKVVRVDGSRIYPSGKSPFAVEILVKKYGGTPAPRTPHFDKNEVFVDIARGDLYEVKLYNDSDYDAAVCLSIDGLSAFAFSDVRTKAGTPRYQHYIVLPHKDTVIRGWHKRNEAPNNFLSFLVTAYGEGASRYAPQPTGKVGVITATFAYAWAKDAAPPRDERSAGNETGFGPPVSQQVQEVQRTIGAVRDVVSIRYSR